LLRSSNPESAIVCLTWYSIVAYSGRTGANRQENDEKHSDGEIVCQRRDSNVLGKIVRELTEWEPMKKSCWVDMREDKDKEPVVFDSWALHSGTRSVLTSV